MGIKAQVSCSMNLNPEKIRKKNIEIKHSIAEMKKEHLSTITKSQEFISSTQGDVVASYQRLHASINANGNTLNLIMYNRIKKNENLVIEMMNADYDAKNRNINTSM